MLKFAFYFMGILPMIYEIWSLSNWTVLNDLDKKVKTAKAANKSLRGLQVTELEGCIGIFNIIYFAWLVIGLFSSQWIVYMVVILISFLSKPLWSKAWKMFDSVFTLLLLFFAVLNAYHFHINIGGLIWNYFFR